MGSMIINAIVKWLMGALAGLAASWARTEENKSGNKKAVDDLKKSKTKEDRKNANANIARRIGR